MVDSPLEKILTRVSIQMLTITELLIQKKVFSSTEYDTLYSTFFRKWEEKKSG